MKEMSLCGFCGRIVEKGERICPECGSIHRDNVSRTPSYSALDRIRRLESNIDALEAELNQLRTG